ncbi:MAG: hypothetical protein ACU833_14495, partial [Gammaproteobacteria bacterium]
IDNNIVEPALIAGVGPIRSKFLGKRKTPATNCYFSVTPNPYRSSLFFGKPDIIAVVMQVKSNRIVSGFAETYRP